MPISQIIRRTIPLFFCLLLAACGSKLNPADVEKIQTGMTKAEVEAILGPPTTVSTQDIPLLQASEYNYKAGKSEVTIVFVNDKVVSKKAQLQN